MSARPPQPDRSTTLDEELQEHFTRAEERWETTRSLSHNSRSNFNEKLAVLSAGSLALLATAATALYNKPLVPITAAHSVTLAVGVAATLLWVSLCLSVFHNLCDSVSLARQARMYMAETLVLAQMKRIMHGFDGHSDYLKADAEWNRCVQSVEQLHQVQHWLSFAAFTLFAAGYADIVWMMMRLLASRS